MQKIPRTIIWRLGFPIGVANLAKKRQILQSTVCILLLCLSIFFIFVVLEATGLRDVCAKMATTGHTVVSRTLPGSPTTSKLSGLLS
jgi:hypothetical protein